MVLWYVTEADVSEEYPIAMFNSLPDMRDL